MFSHFSFPMHRLGATTVLDGRLAKHFRKWCRLVCSGAFHESKTITRYLALKLTDAGYNEKQAVIIVSLSYSLNVCAEQYLLACQFSDFFILLANGVISFPQVRLNAAYIPFCRNANHASAQNAISHKKLTYNQSRRPQTSHPRHHHRLPHLSLMPRPQLLGQQYQSLLPPYRQPNPALRSSA